jgi:hypothetical protein
MLEVARKPFRSVDLCSDICFPPHHMDLLQVREAKKELAAYEEQKKKGATSEGDEGHDLGAAA